MSALEPVFLTSKLSLKRNLSNYNFAISLPEDKAVEIYHKVTHACSLLPDILDPSFQFEFYELEYINLLQQKKYEAAWYLPERIKHISKGQGIAICQHCFILINFDDHISICGFCKNNSEIEQLASILYKVETALGEMLSFAFDNELGFLTSDIHYLGVGLKYETYLASVFNLCSKKEKEFFLKKLKPILGTFFSLGIIQSFDEQAQDLEFVFYLSTLHSSVGNTKDFLQLVTETIEKITNLEIEKRFDLFSKNYDQVYDFILRNFLISKHAILISEDQLFDLITAYLLGIQIGLLTNIDVAVVKKIFFDSRSIYVVEIILDESKISLQDITIKMIERKRANILKTLFNTVCIKEFIE